MAHPALLEELLPVVAGDADNGLVQYTEGFELPQDAAQAGVYVEDLAVVELELVGVGGHPARGGAVRWRGGVP